MDKNPLLIVDVSKFITRNIDELSLLHWPLDDTKSQKHAWWLQPPPTSIVGPLFLLKVVWHLGKLNN
jgi:hypothetical protein